MFAKYIIFDCLGDKRGIIFDHNLQHVDMLKSIPWKPISAGMCCTLPSLSFHDGEPKTIVKTWGDSITLNLKSHKEDYKILLKLLDPIS